MSITSVFPHMSMQISITKAMCDHNGHLNVFYYSKIFGDAIGGFYSNELGFSEDYFESGFSTFSLEDNIKYIKECFVNDIVTARYRLHRINKKLIHLVGVMIDKDNQICAIYETVLGHIDMRSRKTADMSDAFYQNLWEIMQQHTHSAINIPLRLEIKKL